MLTREVTDHGGCIQWGDSPARPPALGLQRAPPSRALAPELFGERRDVPEVAHG